MRTLLTVVSNTLAVCVTIATGSSAFAQSNVTIDTARHFQTIEGWGHGGDMFSNLDYSSALFGIDSATIDSINLQEIDAWEHDLGLTGSRMWEVGSRPDGTGMDNGDCDSLDNSKFQVLPIDTILGKYAKYFADRVHADGYQPSFYSSTSYPTGATASKPWVLNHPGERAQQIWANALWWKQQYGIDMNYAVIFNEPNGAQTPQILADDAKALGPRLAALGLPTKVQFAEAVAPQTDWNIISQVRNDPQLWKTVGRISYHNYGTADPYRDLLHRFADSLGIPTAQTEMGNPTIDDLFNDLLIGGVNYWEVAFSGSNTRVPQPGGTNWMPSATYFRLRQLLHYVRPGDTRVAATSDDSLLRVVAFQHDSDVVTVLLNNGGQKTVALSGLPPGRYGLSRAASGATAFVELGIQLVGNDGKISLNLPGAGTVATLYPFGNAVRPPTIMSCNATSGYIVAPVASTGIVAQVSDPQNLPTSVIWSVALQPPGANATITFPNKLATSVSNMTKPGVYGFRVTATQGALSASRVVYMLAFAEQPPPIPGSAGFRFAAPYGLVFADPGTVTHANVELPTTSATLQLQIGDLANSDFTGRGKWTLVSQPPGANVRIDTTIYIYISIRAQVSNMIVPGDYVFQCNVTNPGHPDLVQRIVCTVHPASAGPIVDQLSALPANPALPADTVHLYSVAHDTAKQLLRQWWVLKQAPAGVGPITFDHQGRTETAVHGLSVAGQYIFTLRSFDDIHMTTRDITVNVAKGTGLVASEQSKITALYPNPARDEVSGTTEARVLSVSLYDELGRERAKSTVSNGNFRMDISALPAGVYWLHMGSSREKLAVVR